MARNSKGQWLPGTSGHNNKGLRSFTSALRRQFSEPPSDILYERAAEVAGVKRSDVPVFERTLELYAWAALVGGLSSIERLREVLDRIDPKPHRLQVEHGPLRAPMQPGTPAEGERAAAEDYYAGLEGALRPEDDDYLH